MDEKLLRELIKEVLQEDDGYGDMGGLDAANTPYGLHYSTRGQLYNTFVKPFTDVVDTVAGKGKELSQKAQTLVHTGIESMATTFLPFLKDSYGEIFRKEQERIDAIKAQYKDVYAATWDAFREHDSLMLAFMYSPGDVLKAKLAKEAPKTALKLLSVLSGGTLDKQINRVLGQFSGSDKKKKDIPFSDTWDEGLVREENDDHWNASKEDRDRSERSQITSYLVKKAVTSPKVQAMRKDASQIVRGSLDLAYKQAQALATAKTVKDLEAKLGKKLPGSEKIDKAVGSERVRAEQTLMQQFKKMGVEFYAKNLEAQVNQAIKGGVPKDSQYVRDYVETIKKIRALAQ